MTITRHINGLPYIFELSSQEMYEAYKEQEHEWDLSDVDAHVGHLYNSDQCKEIARRIRKTLNDMFSVGTDFEYALQEVLLELDYDQEEAS